MSALTRPRQRVPRPVLYCDVDTAESDPLRWAATAPPLWANSMATDDGPANDLTGHSQASTPVKELAPKLLPVLQRLSAAGCLTQSLAGAAEQQQKDLPPIDVDVGWRRAITTEARLHFTGEFAPATTQDELPVIAGAAVLEDVEYLLAQSLYPGRVWAKAEYLRHSY